MDQSAGQSPQMCVRSKHSTSGAFECCWASNGTNLSEMMTFGGKQSNRNCDNPGMPHDTYLIWAHCVHGWQRGCQEDFFSFRQQDWRRPPGRPRITTWDAKISHSLKQSTWFKIALCGGCCRCQALHNLELHARNDDDESLCYLLIVVL